MEVTLKHLRKYNKQIYNSFLGEAVRIDGWDEVKRRVKFNKTMTQTVAFKNTVQGFDYWWSIIHKIENGKQFSDE